MKAIPTKQEFIDSLDWQEVPDDWSKIMPKDSRNVPVAYMFSDGDIDIRQELPYSDDVIKWAYLWK